MADIVFAFDPAIDRPLPRLEAAPTAVAEPIATAATDALFSAAAAARQADAAALVLFGRVLDPQRASPAQAATLRSLITGLAAHGCRTIWLASDTTACADIARATTLARAQPANRLDPQLRTDLALRQELCREPRPSR